MSGFVLSCRGRILSWRGEYGFHHQFFNFQILILVATSGEKLNVLAFAAGRTASVRLAPFELSQRFAQSLPKLFWVSMSVSIPRV